MIKQRNQGATISHKTGKKNLNIFKITSQISPREINEGKLEDRNRRGKENYKS